MTMLPIDTILYSNIKTSVLDEIKNYIIKQPIKTKLSEKIIPHLISLVVVSLFNSIPN